MPNIFMYEFINVSRFCCRALYSVPLTESLISQHPNHSGLVSCVVTWQGALPPPRCSSGVSLSFLALCFFKPIWELFFQVSINNCVGIFTEWNHIRKNLIFLTLNMFFLFIYSGPLWSLSINFYNFSHKVYTPPWLDFFLEYLAIGCKSQYSQLSYARSL